MKLFMHQNIKTLVATALVVLSSFSCKKSGRGESVVANDTLMSQSPSTSTSSSVGFWYTSSDQSNLFAPQSVILNFDQKQNSRYPTIVVDSTTTSQTIDGFGFSLTGGSAYLLDNLDSTTKAQTLSNLFSTDGNSIGVSYLRISIGASDLDANVFSYDDVPVGQTDVNLANFSIDPDRQHLIPILKKILAINPNIKILATPWSPPVWMKTNQSSIGGSLNTAYYDVYAQYFVKYINAMKAEGINIDAITPQNEPQNPYNNPSMLMSASEQTNFIKNSLGPAFVNANLSTKIIIYDHNADTPDYPISVLQDVNAAQYIDGSAFHLYAGNISALSQVKNAFPNKNIYFTEQYTSSSGSFSGDLSWHINNLIIGAPTNWSRNVLEWNLASDPNLGPHTNGGCTNCLGALTISTPSTVTRNVSYYIIANASKFVRPGAVRIGSTTTSNLSTVAFKNTDGRKVLIVINNKASSQTFNVGFGGKFLQSTLAKGSVGTYVW